MNDTRQHTPPRGPTWALVVLSMASFVALIALLILVSDVTVEPGDAGWDGMIDAIVDMYAWAALIPSAGIALAAGLIYFWRPSAPTVNARAATARRRAARTS